LQNVPIEFTEHHVEAELPLDGCTQVYPGGVTLLPVASLKVNLKQTFVGAVKAMSGSLYVPWIVPLTTVAQFRSP